MQVDRFGNLISYTTPLGNTTVTTRDSNGYPTQIVGPDPDGFGPLTAPVTAVEYDAKGNPIHVVFPDGTTESATYHAILNRPVSITDQRGFTTTLVYDNKGTLLNSTDPNGKSRRRPTPRAAKQRL